MLVKVLKIVWVICSVGVLVATFTRYAPDSESDVNIFLLYGMLCLSFPVSIFVAGLFTLLVLLQEQLRVPLLDLIGSNYVGLSVMWLFFFIAGYLQWFSFVPWLCRKWKSWRSK